MAAGVAPRRPHARRLAANRRRRAYPQHTRERVVFCMLRGHSIKDTQAALRHDEKTVFAGLYRAPSQATCYRIRRRFRLTGLTTVEPRRGRMPLLRADEIRAMRALRCARAHTYVHVGPSRRACAPACMRQCSFLRAAGQQHGVCRGDRSRKPRKLLVNRVRHVRAHPSGRTPHA